MAVSDPPFTSSAFDGGPDDLPRTLRRERELREREAREQAAREQAKTEPVPRPGWRPEQPAQAHPGGIEALTVGQLDIPFFHLMRFLLKAVLAGVPALIVLAAMVWGAGHLLQTYFPRLVKMQILILFPPG